MKHTRFLFLGLLVLSSLVNATTFKNIGQESISWRVFDLNSNDYVFKILLPGHVIDLKTGKIYGAGEFEQLSQEELSKIQDQEEVSIQTKTGKIYHANNWSTDLNIDMFDDIGEKITKSKFIKYIIHHTNDSSMCTQSPGIDEDSLLSWMNYLKSINK